MTFSPLVHRLMMEPRVNVNTNKSARSLPSWVSVSRCQHSRSAQHRGAQVCAREQMVVTWQEGSGHGEGAAEAAALASSARWGRKSCTRSTTLEEDGRRPVVARWLSFYTVDFGHNFLSFSEGVFFWGVTLLTKGFSNSEKPVSSVRVAAREEIRH